MAVTIYTRRPGSSTDWKADVREANVTSALYLGRFAKLESDGLTLFYANAPVTNPETEATRVAAAELMKQITGAPTTAWHVWAVALASRTLGEVHKAVVAVYGENLTKRLAELPLETLEKQLADAITNARSEGAHFFLAPEHYFARSHTEQHTTSIAYTEEQKDQVVSWLQSVSAAAPEMLIVAGTVAWWRPKDGGGIEVSNTALVAYHRRVTGYHKHGMHTGSDQTSVSLAAKEQREEATERVGPTSQLDLQIDGLLTRVQICADARPCGEGNRVWDVQLITAFDLGMINVNAHDGGCCFVSDGKQGISVQKGSEKKPSVKGEWGLKLFPHDFRPLATKPATGAQPFAAPV